MEARPYNRWLARLRVVSVYALVAVVLWRARPVATDLALGLPLLLLGESLRVWAAGHLRKTVELVTSGPYRFTRNPLYLGRLLIFTGLCLAARLPWAANWLVLLGGCAVFFLYYLPRKERVEPARLREEHGATYERYRATVPALFPARTPYPEATARRWSFARMLDNREHWMVIALLAIAAYLAWRSTGAAS